MSNDPAFLFYPGDYLRDTQCLSQNSQVAYDRIMCEHMRNICITQEQLKFFTKKLNDDEIQEIYHVLTKVEGGFQIKWVSESICKRKEYSDSRRKNKLGTGKKTSVNISSTYDQHMENENENENEDKIVIKKEFVKNFEISEMDIGKTIQYLDITQQKKYNEKQIKDLWLAFLIQNEDKFYAKNNDRVNHFRDWLKTQKHGTTTNTTGNAGSNGLTRIEALKIF